MKPIVGDRPGRAAVAAPARSSMAGEALRGWVNNLASGWGGAAFPMVFHED